MRGKFFWIMSNIGADQVNFLCIYDVKLDAWIQLRQPAMEDIIWRCMEHKGEVLLVGLDNRNGSSGNELCFYEIVEYTPEKVRPWHFPGDLYFREMKAVPMHSVVDVLAPLYEDIKESTSRTPQVVRGSRGRSNLSSANRFLQTLL
ncbi:hypothetical protein Mp_4g07850 [Marchantia polymorpha subsp. ruderalis]|uniref:Uncharacterized protein n=2 Tax=Marchantia polymorpha TaxID=3197 RepID=A0AAF6B7K0_MARPO|nr:hypothetical protein MARPO_0120s0056 [Marchantia polymorpha]BBN07984.1 hypothetical protein Mp_4g07850 [Marchantia polymorpha subsp. ruderalis]|eukprot:PTQ30786.1 hypothetical protein MARPO_0120s0056 [Marchantia polymorpha]